MVRVFEKLWIRLSELYDDIRGIEWEWQSLDSVSVKAPLERSDRSQSILLIEVNLEQSVMCWQTRKKGIPLSVVIITPANTHDMKAAKDTLDSVITQRPLKQQNHLCLDKRI